MIADMMPGTEEQLQKELTSAYVGIDPTADSSRNPLELMVSAA